MKNLILIIAFSLFTMMAKAEKNNFFMDAKDLFDNKKYEESKFLFYRNIVYNPKDAPSYLYFKSLFQTLNQEEYLKV